MMNDSSMSRWADLEFKLVEPNRVRIGAVSGFGESHTPMDDQNMLEKGTTERNELDL
jgi:hypothetical protein